MRALPSILLLLLSVTTQAAVLTATIDTKNRASLSGDVPNGLLVQFSNTGSKGQVLANGVAVLTLSHWPKATLQSITLYMRSNQSSGAASVTLTVNTASWLVAEGNFNQWPGISGWSSDVDQPLLALSKTTPVPDNSQLQVQISGSANSVYLQKIEVVYTLTSPSPNIVTLQYPSSGGPQCITLMEDTAQAGIILPSVPSADSVLYDGTTTWYWFGWSEQSVSAQPASPLCWQTGDWYGPNQDITLYAVYTNLPTQTLTPDTSMLTGEYALMYAGHTTPTPRTLLLSGHWSGGHIPLTDVQMMPSSQSWQWPVSHLSDSLRYTISFTGDSLTIQNFATQSYLAHSQSAGCNSPKPFFWHWRKVGQGTLLIYSHMPSADDVYCLSTDMDLSTSTIYANYREDLYVPDNPYWHLFPSAQIPNPTEVLYSSLPNYVALPDPPTTPSSPTKIIDRQGRLIIHTNHVSYSILGLPL